jgi:hypothetical protein
MGSGKDDPRLYEGQLTCGVAGSGGEGVQDSEGFCCGCPLNDVRGSLDCSPFNLQESAHCLGFDDLWYSIFEVDRPQIFYDIAVSVAKPDDPGAPWQNATYQETVLVLNHQQPVAEAEGGALRLKLVGDLATATAPHRLESKYLAVPTRPLGHKSMNLKAISQTFVAKEQAEGVGARVKRFIGVRQLPNLDPFLMLDNFNVKLPAGFPDHPHRGMETDTYMLSGEILHEDFKGNAGKLGPGDLQWMTAGKGIVHAEMPASFDVPANGFQLWLNLDRAHKYCEPQY